MSCCSQFFCSHCVADINIDTYLVHKVNGKKKYYHLNCWKAYVNEKKLAEFESLRLL